METEQQVNVLLVDDRHENLLVMEAVLADLGQRLVCVNSGRDALRFLLNEDVAVILLDVEMPGLDGFETAELIRGRERTQHTPIIFVTAINKSEQSVFQGYSLGAVDYITKPFEPVILKSKVKFFIDFCRQKLSIQRQGELLAQANRELGRMNAELEARVLERTEQLQTANWELESEIVERKQAEEQVKASLREKEVLLKEIHHRVKNNLQIISSLLNLQSKHISNEEAREKIKESQNRVKSMALIHEKLYQSKDLSGINFADYIKSLSGYLFSSFGVDSNIKLRTDVDNVLVNIDRAIPCGLIVNEIVSNSLKHAFPDGRGGEISIAFGADNDNRNHTLIINNDGAPFPEDVDFRDTKSLGLQLVCALIEQLKGTIELDRSGGTEFRIKFDL